MILIVSDHFDAHADLVEKKIQEAGKKTFRLNLDLNAISNTTLSFKNNIWTIVVGKNSIRHNEISCIYFRRAFLELSIEEISLEHNINFKIFKNEFNAVLNGLWFSLRSTKAFNSLKNAYIGENKFFQTQIAKQVGLNTPTTIVSNDYIALEHFIIEQGEVIFKLYNQNIYVENDVLKGVYTNKITINDLKYKFSGTQNPIVLQEYVKKKFEVRWIVVGNKHFVCQINSQDSKVANIDWRRYDLANTPHLVLTPPTQIVEKVDALMEKMGLVYGALDFIVTPQDEWIFLEINCFGQWLWIENLTGLDISGSIAKWLTF